jgi:hypothetical protein
VSERVGRRMARAAAGAPPPPPTHVCVQVRHRGQAVVKHDEHARERLCARLPASGDRALKLWRQRGQVCARVCVRDGAADGLALQAGQRLHQVGVRGHLLRQRHLRCILWCERAVERLSGTGGGCGRRGG